MSALSVAEVPNPATGATGPPPHHIFRKNDVCFVYDTTTAQFFAIDECAFAVLDRMQRVPLHDACAQAGVEMDFSGEQIESVAEEIMLLRERGLLRPPVYRLSPAQIEKQLDRRYARPNPKMMLALAENCNLACRYCYNSTSMDAPSDRKMSRETAKRCVDRLFDAAGDRDHVAITFFGGEPLLNKSLFHWVIAYSQEVASKLGKKVRYSMTTNATLLDDAVIDQIKKHNFGLMISMDGPEDLHNAQRPMQGGKPSFTKAAEGVKRLMRRRKRVTVRCTLTNLRPRLLHLVRFFEDFGFARIVLGKVTNSISPSTADCGREDMEHFAEEEERDLLPYAIEHLKNGNLPAHFPYAEFIRKQASRDGKPVRPAVSNCGAANGMVIAGADGDLYPCHRYLGMKNWVVGNVADGGPDTQRLKQYWAKFDAAVSQKCGGCWARLLCNRPCAWEVSSNAWHFGHVPDWDCELRRAYFERAASVMFTVMTHYPEMYAKIVSGPSKDVAEQPARSETEKNAS